MSHPRVLLGLNIPAGPPAALLRFQVALARWARLDSLMVPDHLQSPFPDALWREIAWLPAAGSSSMFEYSSVLGWLAAKAGNVRLGVAVTDPIRRHPAVLAQTMLTLAHLSRRAPILGMGSGERENIEPYGLTFDHPTRRLEEALAILRACFDGTLGDFSGTHFTLRGATVGPTAPPGKVPQIWVGAHGPRMLQLTGRFGDGWIPTIAMFPDEYGAKLEQIRSAARSAGRPAESITGSMACYLLLARDEDEVRVLRRSKLARYLALMTPAAAWTGLGADHPFGSDFKGFVDMLPEAVDRERLRTAMESVPEELSTVGAMIDTLDHIVTRVRGLAEAGLRHFSPLVLTGAVSRRNALHDSRMLPTMARRLQSGR